MQSARIIEIFSSIQGEGLYAGRPHLFVRFWDCNLACRYCDTDYKGPYTEQTGETVLEQVRRQIEGSGVFHAISLTGGEPLLWWRFLKEWLPRLKADCEMSSSGLTGGSAPPRIYLETNGTLPEALEAILR